MIANTFFEAMNHIDDKLLLEVDRLRNTPKKKTIHAVIRIASAAACLCAVVGGLWVWSRYDRSLTVGEGEMSGDAHLNGSNGNTDYSQEGVTIPPYKVNLNPDQMMDMLAFFIYDGRMYLCYEKIEDRPDLVGEYVGRSTGLINEWTEKDGYVDYAGSISGDFYTVNGFDPEFMLCMPEDDGSVLVYINDNALTLHKGADLFEERLHLSGNYTTVEYQTRNEWYYGEYGTIRPLYNEDDRSKGETIERFIAALNDGVFLYNEDVPLDEGEKRIYDREIYHMWFTMNHGVTVHLRLYKGGYVRFDGLIPVCVKMDETVFNEMIDTLE